MKNKPKLSIFGFLVWNLSFVCILVSLFFVTSSSAKADYYQEGVVQSVDLLSGVSDEAWITGFTATSSVPASTTLGFLFSVDEVNWYNSEGEKGVWDTVASGTTSFNLEKMKWATSTLATTSLQFFYKVRMTSNIATATPVVYSVSLEYSDTYSYTEPDYGYAGEGVVQSTDLLTGVSDEAYITGLIATSSVPASTTLEFLFSVDELNWYNSQGSGAWESVATGTTNFNLRSLKWATSTLATSSLQFFYKVRMTSNIATATPVVYAVSVVYSDVYDYVEPDNGYHDEGVFMSNILASEQAKEVQYFGYNLSAKPANTGAKIIFSNDSVNWYSSTGTAWQWTELEVGDYTASSSGFDLTGLNWETDLYYKVWLSSDDPDETPVITEVKAYFTEREPLEFVSIIDPDDGDGTDYTSLSLWEAAVQADLTSTSTLVFSYDPDTRAGDLPDGSTLVGATSGATGTLVHLTGTTSPATSQLMVLVASGKFLDEERVYVEGASGNYVYLTTSGDTVIAVAKCRSTAGSYDESFVDITGWTTSATNYIKVWTDPTDAYGRHDGTVNGGGYTMKSTSGASENSIEVDEHYTVVDGIKIVRTEDNWDYGFAMELDNAGDASYSIIKNNLFIQESVGLDTQTELLWFNRGNTNHDDLKIFNNIFISQTSDLDYGMYFDLDYTDTEAEQSEIYNNTIYGYFDDAAVLVNNDNVSDDNYGVMFFNNYAVNINSTTTVPDFSFNGYYYSTSTIFTNNACDDTSCGSDNGNQRIQVGSAGFVDATNYDLHIKNTSALKDQGTTTASLYDGNLDGRYYDIDGTARGSAPDIGADEVPVDFTSIICEDTDAGGGCADLDYTTLASWETAVDSNLTASTTRVFSGSITGHLEENDTVNLCNGGTDTGINGVIIATTTDQILIDGITGTSTPVNAESGWIWDDDVCGTLTNAWTITGTGDDLGASPRAVAEIDGVWGVAEENQVAISHWTTDNDNSIKVYTTNLARHNGKWSETSYRIKYPASSGSNMLDIRENYVHVDGLQIYKIPGIYVFSGILVDVIDIDSEVSISNNIVTGNQTGAGYGIMANDPDTNLKIWNNIVYNVNDDVSSGDGIWLDYRISPAWIYNNTVFQSHRGIYANGDSSGIFLVNNVIFNNSDWDFDNANWGGGSRNNASSDSSASSATLSNGITLINSTSNFVSIASGTEDFHLKSGSSLINAGFNLTASTTLFTTDIDSGTRNIDGLGWDIGADEVATKIYRSVGNDSSDLSNSATVTISGRTATFSAAQPDNIGVGDVIQFGGAGYYDLAFITARASSTQYSVQAWDGTAPTATTTANMEIFRAHLELDDWEDASTDDVVGDVNSGIDSSVERKVLVGTDLVASNTIMMVACYASDDGDDARVTIADWTTGDNNYLQIYTPVDSDEVGVSQRHNGKWDENKYKLDIIANGSNQGIIGVYTPNARIIGLQMSIDANGESGARGIIDNYITQEGEIHYVSNIMKGLGTGLGNAINLNDGDVENFYVYNNIIYDAFNHGIQRSSSVINAHNAIN